MAKFLETLGSAFVVLDTSPPAPAGGAIALNWTSDFPPTFQDLEKGLLLLGVSLILSTSAAAGNRRVALSFRLNGGQEYARVSSAATQALSLVRGYDFGVGQPAVAAVGPGALLRETLPDGMVILPGHSMVVEIDNLQAADAVTKIAVRGRVVVP